MVKRQQLTEESEKVAIRQIGYFSNVRLNADNSNKKAVCIFWSIFALFEIIIFVTSNYTPEAIVYKTNQSELADTGQKECTNPVDFDDEGRLSCQIFNLEYPKIGLIMRNLSPLNQFAQINLLFLPKNNQDQTITVKQTFKVELMSLVKKQLPVQIANKTAIVFTKGEDLSAIDMIQFDSTEHYLQELTIQGDTKRKGYEVNLGYYRDFKSEDALMVITFMNLEQVYLNNYDILPQAALMNTSYTIFTVVFRGCFLLILLVTLVLFLRRSRRMVEFEQKVVIVISGFGILFNDPYYILGVFRPNLFSVFFSTSFIAGFFMALMLSWICLLQKIISESKGISFVLTTRKKITYGMISGAYFLILFFFIFQLSYYSYTKSPIIPIHSTFRKLYIVTVLLSTGVFGYIAWLYLCVAREWNNVVWRDKLYLTFNVFFIVLNLMFISFGWFSFYDQSSQKFQIFYASMNFYVIYLQYMYSAPFLQDTDRGLKVAEIEGKGLSVSSDSDFITINLEDDQFNIGRKVEKQQIDVQ